MYYWAIKWKSYNVEDLYINEKVKDFIESEWIKEPEKRQLQTFKLDGETYSYNSIDSITKTNKKITDFTKMLYADGAKALKREPLVNDEGDVVTAWYKKFVSTKEYEKTYAPSSLYYLLEKADGGVWVGIRIPIMTNGYRPDSVEPCTEQEAERLWRFLSHS